MKFFKKICFIVGLRLLKFSLNIDQIESFSYTLKPTTKIVFK